MKKGEFFQDQEGQKGGDRRELLCNEFLCLQSKSFNGTSFFHFGINIGFEIPKEEFWKEKVYREIKLILQMQTQKNWLIWVLLLFQVEVRTHDQLGDNAADT